MYIINLIKKDYILMEELHPYHQIKLLNQVKELIKKEMIEKKMV